MTSNGQVIPMQSQDSNEEVNQSVEEGQPRPKWKKFVDRNGKYIKGTVLIVIALIIFLVVAVEFAMREKLPEDKNITYDELEEEMSQRRLPIIDQDIV